MKPIVRAIATSKALWIAALLVLLYALAGFFVAPYALERAVPRYAQEKLGATAAIGVVRVNPFLLTLEANDFRLEGTDGPPPVAFSRLFVDLELSSVLRWAWTFADVQLDGLQVNAEIGRAGRFNLAELAERWAKDRPPASDQAPPRIIARHLQLHHATLAFADLSRSEPARASASAIDLDVTDVATIPERDGGYAISAGLPGGGALSWRGDLTLRPIASKGEWSIRGLKLAVLWQFVRDDFGIAEPGGSLSLAGRYVFSYGNGTTSLALEGVHAQVTALSITQQGAKRPMLALDAVEATDVRYDLAHNELVMPRLQVGRGMLAAVRTAAGAVDWQSLLKTQPRPQGPGSRSTASPFHVHAAALAIDHVAVRFLDQAHAMPLEYAADLHAGAELDIVRDTEKTRFMARSVSLALTDATLRAAGSADSLVGVASITLDGGVVDEAARTLAVEALAIKGGRVELTRAADGRIALADAFAPMRSAAPSTPARADAAAQRWKYLVRAADVTGVRLALVDRGYEPAVRYDVDVTAGLKNVAGDAQAPIGVEATLRVAQGGSIVARGTLGQDFGQASVALDVVKISAEPLRPVLARYTRLQLKSGNASARARLDYRRGGNPALRVAGRAQMVNVLVNEADTGDRFVSWATLTADGAELTLAPDRVTVKEVRVQAPGAKIVVAKDRVVNVSQVMKPPGDARAQAPAGKAQGERFVARVARVVLEKGTLDFADNSLVLPFATRVTSLDGTIVGLSSLPRSRAELKLAGLIEPSGTASAAGSLQPADPRSFLDLNVKFDNVEMLPLSPYTATFAGRKVAAGRLSLDLDYKIVDAQLLGENRVVLTDFELGERVEAPNALDLPLDLAVALLKEPDGRIHLAVPVRGDVDHPQFDYGALIRQAIVATLTRIVSAPFRFIAGLLGGDSGEDLDSVEFDPGSARLAAPMRERLQKITRALKERPQLKVVVHGAYGPARDGRALRDVEVRRAVAQALDVKLRPGEDPGPLALDDADTQVALEKLLVARAGSDAVDRLAAKYAQASGKEARRVNPLLARLGRGRGDRALYQALFEQLVQGAPLPDAALADLATLRARAVADLIGQGGIDSARVGVGASRAVEDPSQPLATKLALESARGAP